MMFLITSSCFEVSILSTLLTRVYVGVCMCGFCNVWECVYVGFIMCGSVYV